jgi:GNAT superfamily N-acetyltransferase
VSAAFSFPIDSDLAQLLVSDEVYFRIGAQVRHLPACELAFVPGLTHVQAGCVVQRVSFQAATAQDADAWIDRVEAAVRETGAPLSRIYLHHPHGPLTPALAKRGYRSRRELAFSADPVRVGLESQVTLQPVATEAHWAERLRLHVECPDNSDGYHVAPESWCELIRRKCATGIKESFLIRYQGRVCGSVGAIQMKNVLRPKNLMIHSDFRRTGLGHEALHELAALAHGRGLHALAMFGIEGEGGAALYRRAGFSVIGWQTEWCRKLEEVA